MLADPILFNVAFAEDVLPFEDKGDNKSRKPDTSQHVPQHGNFSSGATRGACFLLTEWTIANY